MNTDKEALNKYKPFYTKIILLLFFLLSLLPILWLTNNTKYSVTGYGDFISPINQEVLLEKRIFVYDPSLYGGIHTPFHLAGIVPITIFFYVLKILTVPYVNSAILSISILLFIAETSMYFYIRQVLRKVTKLDYSNVLMLSFFSGILYAFSPFFASFLEPGHFLLLLPYSFFPLIMLLFHKFLQAPKFTIQTLIYLFLVFFFCATSFENIGIIYSLLIALGCYFIFLTFFEKLPVLKTTFRFLLVVISIFASNIWWILPFTLSLGQVISENNATNGINQALDIAIRYATVPRLFLNEEPIFGKHVATFSGYLILYSYLWFFALVALLKIHKRIITVFLLMILVGIFISKGSQEPFGVVFMWLYNHFPGFQIFRRPVSKFYWVYYFFLCALSFGGIAHIVSIGKSKVKLFCVYIPLILFSAFFTMSFIHADHMSFFNVPQSYYDARKYLIHENVNKILLIPGFFGDQPYYNKTVNWYHGDDFLKYFWNFQTVETDPSSGTFATYEKQSANKLMAYIRENKSICELTRDQGISHIMVRQDILTSAHIEDQPKNLVNYLNKNPDIKKKKFFGTQAGGFTLYSMKDGCRSNIVTTTSKDASLIAYFQNPVRIAVSVREINGKIPLILNLNYDPGWSVYLLKKNNQKNEYSAKNYVSGEVSKQYSYELTDLQNGEEIAKNSHTLLYGYANEWMLDPVFIKQHFSSDYVTKNRDGSISFDLVLYYTPQRHLYWGLIIQSILFVGILIYISSI